MESGSSSDGAPFRSIIRNRLLVEMLGGSSLSQQGGIEWKVLIMDDFTLKVMSSTCKMADITDAGVSLVEDLKKKRQPMPSLDAVYFIQPSSGSISRLMEDMGGAKGNYKRAFIFFSSPVSKEHLQRIKENAQLRSRLGALREMNLEISTVDKHGFTTEQDRALVELFGEDNHNYERCIDHMAARLATVFASLKEFPSVRYRSAKTSSTEAGTAARGRDLVPTKLAAGLWDRLLKYKQNLHGFPAHDTCDLLILDRSTDPVTPVIHDWSYGGMAFDLLPLDGNKYTLEINTESGKKEEKIVILEEHDFVWTDLRDLFIGDALAKVTKLADEIVSRQVSQRGELSAKEMQALIATMGKYREQKDKVDLHVNIAETLMTKVKRDQLINVGKLEQGFVFGDSTATFKELFNMLGGSAYGELNTQTKLRLLAVYAATHPEKFTPDKRETYMERADLEPSDMEAVNNMDYLGLNTSKPSHSKTSTLTFGKKGKNAYRVERENRGGDQELMRYYPLLHDLVEDLHKGVLDKVSFPYVQEPHGSSGRSNRTTGGSSSSAAISSGSGGAGWASKRTKPASHRVVEVDSISSSSRESFSKNRRIFVFIVGGMTRSELRAAHQLTKELNREVIIGSSSLETAAHFLEKLSKLKP